MMTLTTVSKQNSEKSVYVYWRVGTNRKGLLNVRLNFKTTDPEIVAELVAIRYLIMEAKVFRCTPNSGKGFRLNVSKGAILKMTQGRSSKRSISRFAGLLTGRMNGVQIIVSHSMDFMIDAQEAIEAGLIEVLEATKEKYASTVEIIKTPAIGQLGITRHAVRRYEERLCSRSPEETLYRPWASLFSRLRNPDLKRIPLAESVKKHKMRRYGDEHKVEIWSHPSDTTCYTIVVCPRKTKTLVTVFNRSQRYFGQEASR